MGAAFPPACGERAPHSRSEFYVVHHVAANHPVTDCNLRESIERRIGAGGKHIDHPRGVIDSPLLVQSHWKRDRHGPGRKPRGLFQKVIQRQALETRSTPLLNRTWQKATVSFFYPKGASLGFINDDGDLLGAKMKFKTRSNSLSMSIFLAIAAMLGFKRRFSSSDLPTEQMTTGVAGNSSCPYCSTKSSAPTASTATRWASRDDTYAEKAEPDSGRLRL